MADWVWVESPGSSVDETPRLRTASFGDGYEQRAPDGINNLVQKQQLQFNDVADEVAADMVAFLRAHKDGSTFDYVPLWETVASKWKCTSWKRTLGTLIGTSSISATFEQVFEP